MSAAMNWARVFQPDEDTSPEDQQSAEDLKSQNIDRVLNTFCRDCSPAYRGDMEEEGRCFRALTERGGNAAQAVSQVNGGDSS